MGRDYNPRGTSKTASQNLPNSDFSCASDARIPGITIIRGFGSIAETKPLSESVTVRRFMNLTLL